MYQIKFSRLTPTVYLFVTCHTSWIYNRMSRHPINRHPKFDIHHELPNDSQIKLIRERERYTHIYPLDWVYSQLNTVLQSVKFSY